MLVCSVAVVPAPISARLTVNAPPLSIVIATEPGSPPDMTVFFPKRGKDGTAPLVTVADSKLAVSYTHLTLPTKRIV